MKWYARLIERLGLTHRPRLRKVLVAVLGGTILLFGLALVVLPGPAVVVVPVGLAILATEFAWARRLVRRGGDIWQRWRGHRQDDNSLGHDAR